MFKYVLHVWGAKLQRISHPTKYFGRFLSFRGSDPCFGLVSSPLFNHLLVARGEGHVVDEHIATGVLRVHDDDAVGAVGIKGELMGDFGPAVVVDAGIDVLAVTALLVGIAAHSTVVHGHITRTNGCVAICGASTIRSKSVMMSLCWPYAMAMDSTGA